MTEGTLRSLDLRLVASLLRAALGMTMKQRNIGQY